MRDECMNEDCTLVGEVSFEVELCCTPCHVHVD